jgi:hypothetical protein
VLPASASLGVAFGFTARAALVVGVKTIGSRWVVGLLPPMRPEGTASDWSGSSGSIVWASRGADADMMQLR